MEKDHMEVLPEDIRSKFDLVLEGHQVLRGEIREFGRNTEERFDLVDFKIDTLNRKIDSVEQRLDAKIDAVEKKLDTVATDLSEHRRDTEAHGRGYLVSE